MVDEMCKLLIVSKSHKPLTEIYFYLFVLLPCRVFLGNQNDRDFSGFHKDFLIIAIAIPFLNVIRTNWKERKAWNWKPGPIGGVEQGCLTRWRTRSWGINCCRYSENIIHSKETWSPGEFNKIAVKRIMFKKYCFCLEAYNWHSLNRTVF